jgi:hypothetical protein
MKTKVLVFFLLASVFLASEVMAGLIGRVYVGEFEAGSSRVSQIMEGQIMEALSRLPQDKWAVKIYAYTDKSGRLQANRELAQERLLALGKVLSDFLGYSPEYLEAKAFAYEPGLNLRNKRFGIIEFWSANEAGSGNNSRLVPSSEVEEASVTVSNTGANSHSTASASSNFPSEIEESIKAIEASNNLTVTNVKNLDERLKNFESELKILRGAVEGIEAKLDREPLSVAPSQAGSNLGQVKSESAKFPFVWLISAVALLVLLGIAGLVVGILNNRRLRTQKIPSIEQIAMIVAPQNKRVFGKPCDKEYEFSVKDGDLTYFIKCRVARDDLGNTVWTSPFFNVRGGVVTTTPIIRKDGEKFRYSLRDCLRKVQFASQKEELIRKGVIKIEKKDETVTK